MSNFKLEEGQFENEKDQLRKDQILLNKIMNGEQISLSENSDSESEDINELDDVNIPIIYLNQRVLKRNASENDLDFEMSANKIIYEKPNLS